MSGITVIDLNDAIPRRPKPYRRTPTRPVRITEEQVADTKILAKQMNSIEDQIGALALVTQLFDAAILFLNVPLGAGGTITTLGHNFGRFAFWLVVGWSGAATAAAPSVVSDADDASPTTSTKILSLRSYVAGNAAVLVF